MTVLWMSNLGFPSLPVMPSMPQLPSLSDVPTSVWVAMAVILVPIIVVFGSLAIKLLWGLWPIPISLAASAYAVYRMGLEWFFLVALGIAGGIVFTWLWQRTRIFLRGDRMLEKGMFLGD